MTTEQKKPQQFFPKSPPRFFSLAFHKNFFPSLLRQWLFRHWKKSEEYSSPFASHAPLEFTLAIVGCFLLSVIGIPSLLLRHSVIGGILSFLGWGGLIAMFVNSLRSERKTRKEIGGRYGYEHFIPTIFFFCLMLGVTIGLSAGFFYKNTWLVVASSLLGALLGYFIGIFSGIGINYLGWFGTYIVYLSILAMIVMAFLDIILIAMMFF